jgi:hypothetical protein
MALDHTAYPHILQRVLSLSPWSSKLRLRALSRSIRDALDAELFHHLVLSGRAGLVKHSAPGNRPLPLHDPHTLAHVRVLDWGIPLPHPAISLDDPEDAEYRRATLLHHLRPLLRLRPHIVRADDAQLVPVPAPHYIVFNNYVAAGPGAGPWLHWGEGLLLLPPGVQKLTLHTRFDPRHPALAGSTWDLAAVADYPLEELVVLPRPAEDEPRSRVILPQRAPTLGFLDDLLAWGLHLASGGTRVTVVGMDSLPPNVLLLPDDVGDDEREDHVVAGLAALGKQGEIRRISWAEYKAETTREEYALTMVRPRFVSGKGYHDDHLDIFPPRENHLDWLEAAEAPPPLSPRLSPLDGD